MLVSISDPTRHTTMNTPSVLLAEVVYIVTVVNLHPLWYIDDSMSMDFGDMSADAILYVITSIHIKTSRI